MRLVAVKITNPLITSKKLQQLQNPRQETADSASSIEIQINARKRTQLQVQMSPNQSQGSFFRPRHIVLASSKGKSATKFEFHVMNTSRPGRIRSPCIESGPDQFPELDFLQESSGAKAIPKTFHHEEKNEKYGNRIRIVKGEIRRAA